MIKHFVMIELKKKNEHTAGGSAPERVYYIINKSKYGINCFDIDINGGIECDTQHIWRDEIQRIDIFRRVFYFYNILCGYDTVHLFDPIILRSQIYTFTR